MSKGRLKKPSDLLSKQNRSCDEPAWHAVIWAAPARLVAVLAQSPGLGKRLLHAQLSAHYRNASRTPHYGSAAVCKPGLPGQVRSRRAETWAPGAFAAQLTLRHISPPETLRDLKELSAGAKYGQQATK